ncbi:hypothetical protein A9K58_02920 [Stenotrophomonas maltophilia]|uniref:Uncharacterized protein n=1 Tax=Stenotrophomonas maltophilia TaxID=40324 RepID=A0A1A6Y372_STEMA|nr:hypothetical protein A9K58_02920 [Stenotrophomonas maltophilia]
MQGRLVAVLDHQRHAVAACGADQRLPMHRGIAYFQRMLQGHPLQLPGQLGHQRFERLRIGRMARIELP